MVKAVAHAVMNAGGETFPTSGPLSRRAELCARPCGCLPQPSTPGSTEDGKVTCLYPVRRILDGSHDTRIERQPHMDLGGCVVTDGDLSLELDLSFPEAAHHVEQTECPKRVIVISPPFAPSQSCP